MVTCVKKNGANNMQKNFGYILKSEKVGLFTANDQY